MFKTLEKICIQSLVVNSRKWGDKLFLLLLFFFGNFRNKFQNLQCLKHNGNFHKCKIQIGWWLLAVAL